MPAEAIEPDAQPRLQDPPGFSTAVATKQDSLGDVFAGAAREMLAAFRDGGAEKINGIAGDLHRIGDRLEAKDPNLAQIAHEAAERVGQLRDYVRNADLARLRQDTRDVARRHPVLLFAGLFCGGLLLGNVMKARSTGPAEDSDEFPHE